MEGGRQGERERERETQGCDAIGFRQSPSSSTPPTGSLSLVLLPCSLLWLYGYAGVLLWVISMWVRRCVGVRLYGCMGVWVCGCMGAEGRIWEYDRTE